MESLLSIAEVAERRALLQTHLDALRDRMARLEGAAQALEQKISHYEDLQTQAHAAVTRSLRNEEPLHSVPDEGVNEAHRNPDFPRGHKR